MLMSPRRHNKRHTGGAEHSILLVEDHEGLAQMYSAGLSDSYEITTVHRSDEALRSLTEETDLVLLDRHLPIQSGDNLLKEIRRTIPTVSVVVVTGTEPDDDVSDLEIEDYLTKPVSKEELLKTVESVLHFDSYNETMGEYYRLNSKLIALENSQKTGNLEKSTKYHDLKSRVAVLRDELDTSLAGLKDEDFRQMFRRIQ